MLRGSVSNTPNIVFFQTTKAVGSGFKCRWKMNWKKQNFCLAENILCEILISYVFICKISWKFEESMVKYETDLLKYYKTKGFHKEGKEYFTKLLSALKKIECMFNRTSFME